MIDSSDRTKLHDHAVRAYEAYYRSMSEGKFGLNEKWFWGVSRLHYPTFNIFMPLASAALTDDTLADVAAFFSNRGVLYAVELIHDRLPDGANFLDRHSYQPLPPQPAMVLPDLTALETAPPPRIEIEIQTVRTVPSLSAFCTLQHAVFGFALSAMARVYTVAQLKSEIITHYLAFVDERPVGAGTLICSEDVASIWNVCTLDDYRRQGVATTMLHHLLHEARYNYAKLAMLYTTPQAYHLFTTFGFEIYTQRQWFLPPGLTYEDDDN